MANIYEKLEAIGDMVDIVVKKKKGFKYTYADISEILAKVTAGMSKQHVLLIPMVKAGTFKLEPYSASSAAYDAVGKPVSKTSTEMIVGAEMIFRWLNVEDPADYLDVPWVVTGSQGDPSQAFGSGLTYCTRYFLTNFFHIAMAETAKDVDTFRSEKDAAEQAEALAICASIIEEFQLLLKEQIEKNPDKADEYKRFVSKYAPKAEFKKIKNPTVAAELLADFKAKYLTEEE